tara:strand:- start:1347 stop:1625 length:279 start_codon:yes stop_codon:yes gene_type:complete
MSYFACIHEKRFRLKEEIDMNCCPHVTQASGAPTYCFGDLCEIGYAEKLSESVGGTCCRECWLYKGPHSIFTSWYGEMKAGDKTEWIEVDYS